LFQTEWCYNYHDEERSWACNNRVYPTPEEQYHFVSTYLTHQPANAGGYISPMASPVIRGRTSAAFAPLDLDEGSDRPDSRLSQTDQSKDDDLDTDVRSLMQQTRMWRAMNSAQWVAWGIVQAKVPGMEEGIAEMLAARNGSNDEGEGDGDKTPTGTSGVEEEDEGDFDYLAYAQDRVMFFWGDLLSMNLIKAEDLPAPLVEHIKSRLVEY
jgi:choline kinase